MSTDYILTDGAGELTRFVSLAGYPTGLHDPFIPFENLVCAVFFGGIWDAITRAINKGADPAGGGPKENKDAATKKKD